MTRLEKAIVLITGASSGIGEACARAFADAGANLIITARRNERLEQLSQELKNNHKSDVLAIELDVRDQQAVEEAIPSLPDAWKKIDVLVNNAGLSRGLDKIYEGKIQDWEEMVDTNVKGLLYVSRAVLPGMVERNKGTVINIGSIAGREVYQKGNVYCATKFAVDALTKGMRLDLVDTQVRVCTVDPGLVETEFSQVRFRGDAERAKKVYSDMTPLTGDDVAEAVVFAASRPPHVQCAEILLLPTDQAGPTMVHRRK